MNKTRVGIIGCGGIARWAHIPNYKEIPGVEIAACADINENVARKLSEDFKIPKHYKDYKEMLEKENLDAVSVCTPNMFHKDPAIFAMKNGAHVLTEKPMAGSLKDAKEMYEASKKYNKILIVGFQTRFSPDIIALKSVVELGELGEVYYTRALHLRRWGIPVSPTFINKNFSGGGPLLDIGCYAVDTAMYVLGFPKPRSILGVTYTKFGKNPEMAKKGSWGGSWKVEDFQVEDNAFAFIKFEKDASMLLETNWASFMKEDILNIALMGTKGGAQLKPLELYKEIAGARVTITPQDKLPEVNTQKLKILNFIESVRQGKALYSPAEESIKVMAILDAVYRSAEKGKEVNIEWDFE